MTAPPSEATLAAWKSMKRKNKEHGIDISWESYEDFRLWADGATYYEVGMKLFRTNRDMGYSPENCKWVKRIDISRASLKPHERLRAMREEEQMRVAEQRKYFELSKRRRNSS